MRNGSGFLVGNALNLPGYKPRILAIGRSCMHQPEDLETLFCAIHNDTEHEMSRLMSGFFQNAENSLFEIAYATRDQQHQRLAIETMRSLRKNREELLSEFLRCFELGKLGWLSIDFECQEPSRTCDVTQQMADKCFAHYSGVLTAIAEYIARANQHPKLPTQLPIHPIYISQHFMMACRTIAINQAAYPALQDLFSRFVLDRLGHLYGQVHFRLRKAHTPKRG